MISYLHLPLIFVSFFVLLSIWRFWYCVQYMGFTKEIGRRAPQLAQGDILATSFAAQPFMLAIIDWFQIVLPNLSAPLPSVLTVLISIACLAGCLYVLRNSTERISGHWAGTRDSVLRTLAALHIINSAELIYADKKVQEHVIES